MKDIKGYEGLYAITTEGDVWSYKSKRFLKPVADCKGYLFVRLCKDGKVKSYRLHRLVAEAYLPNPDNLPQINHRDENKTNNCLQNLEWCDASYNTNYGTRNEKVSNSKKIPILQYDLDGNLIREWPSATDVGKEVNGNICNCLKGRYKSAYGYIWKYKEWYKHSPGYESLTLLQVELYIFTYFRAKIIKIRKK